MNRIMNAIIDLAHILYQAGMNNQTSSVMQLDAQNGRGEIEAIINKVMFLQWWNCTDGNLSMPSENVNGTQTH